jgi:hypothetical protein
MAAVPAAKLRNVVVNVIESVFFSGEKSKESYNTRTSRSGKKSQLEEGVAPMWPRDSRIRA